MNIQTPKVLGRHVILELYDCPEELLFRPKPVEELMLEAAVAMKATVVSADFHAFSPYGVSGVIVIQESHLTIHTWPEYGYAAIDVFSCGEINIEAGVASLLKGFQAKRHWQRELPRGLSLQENIKNEG